MVHSSQWISPTAYILSDIAAEGARGVQLFFMASSLTLFLSMASRKDQEKRFVLAFFIRRFFRIAPAFYLAIIFYNYGGISAARYWAPNGLEWWYIPLTAFFLNGWHPETITSVVPGGWSIAVEMTFYLFVPYLFSKLNSIKSTLVALFLILVFSRVTSIAITSILSPYYSDTHQYLVSSFSFLWFFSQLPIFILGILLYHLINKYPKNDNRMALFLLFSSLYLFALLLTAKTFSNLFPKHFLYGIAFLLFALSLHYRSPKFFVNRFTVLIGRLSFSIYLVHFMVLSLMKSVFSDGFFLNGNLGFILAFSLVMALSICFSYITHKTVEIPGINLGKHVIKKLEQNPVPTVNSLQPIAACEYGSYAEKNASTMTKKVFTIRNSIAIGCCLLFAFAPYTAQVKFANTLWPGERSSFHSFVQYNFKIDNLNCKVVVPDKVADGKPWIWRARFFGHEPQTDIALLKKGYHVAYVDVSGLFGSPKAVERWDKFYKYLTESRGLSKKPVLEGMSRGGLIIYNWAAKNPDKVSCIYADAPVCDFKSWPGINKDIMNAYGFTEEQAKEYKGNPIDNLKPLAEAGVPLLHVVGDADKVVPVAENTLVIEKRYKKMGGKIKVIHKKNAGHHPHSLKDPTPIVDFILKHTQHND